jgi:fumarate reductase flavoprotein subunit
MNGAESSYDVIVIGGGIAGMVSANRAAEHGKRVAVLEKSTEEQYICNSRITYGTFHINFNSPMAGEDKLAAIIESATEGYARKDLARTIARDGSRLMQWLGGEGIELIDVGQYHTHVLSPVQRSGAGLRWNGFAGDVALKRLEANLKKRGGELLRATRATSLKLVPGGIVVAAEQQRVPRTFRAAAVVIADGGFQANKDMVRQHISREPGRLLQRHGGTAVGDGLRMAQALGATASSEMGNFYGHLHSREAMNDARLWPRPQADDLAAAGIVVDASGRRVADEGYGGIYLSNAIARLPDPLGTTIIFDHAIWDGPPGRGHVQPPNPLVPETGGTLHSANTVAELAAKAGLPAQRLEAVVGEYNSAIDQGTLDRLTPARSADRIKPWPVRTAPFYAMPICTAITNTMGGIVVDGDARVLDAAGKPIPGLYAAGSTVGGLDGGPHSGYVGGLIKATIGYRAADAIAASARPPRN